jgi:2',3'-cyclic-nucleotide 2'-phosphodiesterase (5'-nucleotidase family)
MKRKIKKENSVLLKISSIVFIALLAIYIPLKVYISHSEKKPVIRGQVALTIFITHNIWCSHEFSGGRESGNIEENSPLKKTLFDSIKSATEKEHALLVDLCGISCCKANKYPGLPFPKEAQLLKYDAIAVGLHHATNNFHDSKKLGYSSLPFTSANIINTDGKTIFNRWIIKETVGLNSKTGEMVKIKIGIFSVTFADSASDQNSQESHTIINPKIASLEAVTRMKNEMCDLIIALSRTSPEKSIDLATSVSGIDILINASESGVAPLCRPVHNLYILNIAENSPPLQEINIKLTEDSLTVIPHGQRHPR